MPGTKRASATGQQETQKRIKHNSKDEVGLQWLLGKVGKDEFFSTYWEKMPLLVKANDQKKEWCQNLFGMRQLKAALEEREGKLLFGRDLSVCRMDSNGHKENLTSVAQAAALDSKNMDTNENVEVTSNPTVADQVLELYNKFKGTVQLYQPQRYNDQLWKLLSTLETEFGCLVGSNLYATPKDSQGLAPHHDDVEIFVIQTEGKKLWRLHELKDPEARKAAKLSLEHSGDFNQNELEAPFMEFTMEPGDVLYFPRGTIHQARALPTEASSHITLSTYQRHSWGNLLEHMLPRMINVAMETDVTYREGVPNRLLCDTGNMALVFSRLEKSAAEKLGEQCHDEQQRLSTVHQNARSKVASLLRRMADSIEQPLQSDSTAEDIPPLQQEFHDSLDHVSLDFMQNRLPPFNPDQEVQEGPPHPSKFEMVEADTLVRLSNPDSLRWVVVTQPVDDDDEEELDGEADSEMVIELIDSSHNERDAHMGQTNDDESVDCEDSSHCDGTNLHHHHDDTKSSNQSQPKPNTEADNIKEGNQNKEEAESDSGEIESMTQVGMGMGMERTLAALMHSYPNYVAVKDLPMAPNGSMEIMIESLSLLLFNKILQRKDNSD